MKVNALYVFVDNSFKFRSISTPENETYEVGR